MDFQEAGMVANNKRGCAPKFVPPVPDTFENVIKALVKPVRNSTKQESNGH